MEKSELLKKQEMIFILANIPTLLCGIYLALAYYLKLNMHLLTLLLRYVVVGLFFISFGCVVFAIICKLIILYKVWKQDKDIKVFLFRSYDIGDRFKDIQERIGLAGIAAGSIILTTIPIFIITMLAASIAGEWKLMKVILKLRICSRKL